MDATRLALVHDWLTGMRGGEKCLESLCCKYPTSSLHTLIHTRGKVSPSIEAMRPRTSFLQHLPKVECYYRYLLPLMPFAANWHIPDCHLVVSFSHCVAKSAQPPAGVPHLCYCFSPMRYAWHMRESYLGNGRFSGLKRRGIEKILSRMREWDRKTADRVTHFVAISRTVRDRIRDCYDRESQVIYPPVDTDFYTPTATHRDDFYLCVSALAPYKRIDLAVEACRRMNRRLVVIGAGQDAKRLKATAGPNVEFLGWQPDEVIRDYYRKCRALLFPGEEDFGIVPVEAMACGSPVIAFGRGGATETVRDIESGLFFEEQTSDSLIATMETFERMADRFDPATARRQSLRFTARRFEDELFGLVDAMAHPRKTTAQQPLAA